LSLFDAKKLAEKLGATIPERKGGDVVEFSIAELFNRQSEGSKQSQVNRKVGLI